MNVTGYGSQVSVSVENGQTNIQRSFGEGDKQQTDDYLRSLENQWDNN